ncbi:MAG: glutamate--tRNA ligase [Acidobacteriota bacterium]|jgi:glutamyl-tRNA synthetase
MPKDTTTGPVRVRFAPSPTGYLHVGGARTAIYNELLRRNRGGALILRIEDTDVERSDEAMIRRIREALEWLGVEWDEGPHLQSAGLERHRELVERLLDQGKAYRCFCTPEELEAMRREARERKETFKYPRRCLGHSREESDAMAAEGRPHAVRFKLPEGPVAFDDLVRGEVTFGVDAALDDFVILRTDGTPTYHMSVVADDMDMRVTHVIRGEDHLSNTPKHVRLFEALGAPVPVFAHLPLILGTDKKRLSKRTGATSVEEFRDQGVLHQALYNYLVLLGWSPGDDREILSRDEVIELFTVERLNASAAVFDPEKLAWVNAQYMSGLPLEEILAQLGPFLEEQGVPSPEEGGERLERAVELHRMRAKNLRHLAEVVRPYFRDRLEYDPELCQRFFEQQGLTGLLEALRERYRAVDPYTIDSLDTALRDLAKERGVKAAVLIHPLRMALSGDKAGPPVFDLVEAMGREATDRHLSHFIEYLESRR